MKESKKFNSKKDTILITGGTGYIGNKIVELLEKSNFKVLLLTRKKDIKKYQNNIKIVSGDLNNKKDLKKIKEKIKNINIVIHLAAWIPKKGSENLNKIEYLEKNINSVNNLLQCLPHDLKKFIFCSSVDVYGESEYLPIDESHPTNPTTYYGLSKLVGEKMIQLFCEENIIELLIVRPTSVYGPGDDDYGKMIPIFVKQAISKENIQIFGTGKEKGDYIYIDDVADFFLQGLKNGNGIINLVTGEDHSANKIIEIINQSIEPKNSLNIFYKKIPNPIKDKQFSNIKALKEMNWKPKTSFSKGLKDEIKYYTPKNEK